MIGSLKASYVASEEIIRWRCPRDTQRRCSGPGSNDHTAIDIRLPADGDVISKLMRAARLCACGEKMQMWKTEAKEPWE